MNDPSFHGPGDDLDDLLNEGLEDTKSNQNNVKVEHNKRRDKRKLSEASRIALANYRGEDIDTTGDTANHTEPRGIPIKVEASKEPEVIDLVDLTDMPSPSEANSAGRYYNNNSAPVLYKQEDVKTESSQFVRQYEELRRRIAMENSISSMSLENPQYVPWPMGFTPTWEEMEPPAMPTMHSSPYSAGVKEKHYQLSLLNVNQFTITGLPTGMGLYGPRTSVVGLRKIIKKIARDHGGTAVFRRNKEKDDYDDEEDASSEGRWRIPISAYNSLVSYLQSDATVRLETIPDYQLKIASLERARQEKGYPTEDELIKQGVPKGIASALAPFQRGGVQFVLEKEGRALIADDMGLGKTIQGIASMAAYRDEWPILVLTPSSARYHWEAEFNNWLGMESRANIYDSGDQKGQFKDRDLLKADQVHVLGSSKDRIIPTSRTRVVICSYGLAPALISSKKLVKGVFKCAIVDESHMLKNKKAKRTMALVPILSATTRCVLLSGTPALARPAELYPQLCILGTEKYNWWKDETEFTNRYVRGRGATRRAELHAMLTGTVMIRRLKQNILKSMPPKLRDRASIKILDRNTHDIFQDMLDTITEGEGTMSKLAQIHKKETKKLKETFIADPDLAAGPPARIFKQNEDDDKKPQKSSYTYSIQLMENEIRRMLADGRALFARQIKSSGMSMNEQSERANDFEENLQAEVEEFRKSQLRKISEEYNPNPDMLDGKHRTAVVLNRLYCLTGEVKIPLMVTMLRKWLEDRTKGKLCIFAHHKIVLDALLEASHLSNAVGSRNKYIRIDGSTTPRFRQEQITMFQNDPSYRIALLGITAAGVAVTLTAASTVWFAELYWTPAILIQAEDRCHRIGQQAQVKCLYFVARGTLDDILWKLIEKKFKALGEFVEGKEKQKIIINKEYKSLKDISQIFTSESDMQNYEAIDSNDEGDDDDEELDVSGDVLAEIEKMGQEEEKVLMSRLNGGEDDDSNASDSKIPALSLSSRKSTSVFGATEDNAIELYDDDGNEEDDDDDDDDDDDSTGGNLVANPLQMPFASSDAMNLGIDQLLGNCRQYKIAMRGPSLGFEVAPYRQRIIVCKNSLERTKRLGKDCKPHTGDIIVAVNGRVLPFTTDTQRIYNVIREEMNNSMIVMTFVESERFSKMFIAQMEQEKQARKKRRIENRQKEASQPPPEEVIELLDDD